MTASASASCSARLEPEHVYVIFLHGGAEESPEHVYVHFLHGGAEEILRVDLMSAARSSSTTEGSCESAGMESAESTGMEPRFTRCIHTEAGNQDDSSNDGFVHTTKDHPALEGFLESNQEVVSCFPSSAVHNQATSRNIGNPSSELLSLQGHSSDVVNCFPSSSVHNQATTRNTGNPSSVLLSLQGHSSDVYLHSGLHPRPSVSACPVVTKIDVRTYEEFRDWLYSKNETSFNTIFDVSMMQIDISQVVRHKSFEDCLGVPLQQTVPSTCALVSSTVCIEAQHRLQYEMIHGAGSFPCIAAAPRKLRHLCYRRGIWNVYKGAVVGDVLDEIMRLGGVMTTNAPTPAPSFLPLRSWQWLMWKDGLSADDVADLLDSYGPFIGNIWYCPWYDLFDSDEDDDLVYWSGCARGTRMKDLSRDVFKEDVCYHSVVCFEYRFCAGQMHVHILDNHAANGPRRWIQYEEIEDIYLIDVERMDQLSGLRYPHSGYHGS